MPLIPANTVIAITTAAKNDPLLSMITFSVIDLVWLPEDKYPPIFRPVNPTVECNYSKNVFGNNLSRIRDFQSEGLSYGRQGKDLLRKARSFEFSDRDSVAACYFGYDR